MTTAERIAEIDLLPGVLQTWLRRTRATGEDEEELMVQIDRLLDFRLRFMAAEKQAA